MSSLNQLQMIGNIGKDPEMTYTQNGAPCTKFSIAIDQGFGTTRSTLWMNVVIWGKADGGDNLATRMNEWLYKGCKVFVQGSLTVRKYPGKDGIERTAVECLASNVEILTPRKDKASSGEGEEEDKGF